MNYNDMSKEELKKEIEKLKKYLKRDNRTMEEALEKAYLLDKENKKLKYENEAFKADNETKEASIKAFIEDKERLNSEVEKWKSENCINEVSLKRAKREFKEMFNKAKEQANRIEELEEWYRKASEEINAKDKEIVELKLTIRTMSKVLL